MPWSTSFDDDPILLPRGSQLVTLEDAGNYITGLPKAEHMAPEWQAAMECLILVVEMNGPPMMARIGVVRALNRADSLHQGAPLVAWASGHFDAPE
jgi:hypothetical protein